MYKATHCPCCGAQQFDEQASVIAPFLQEYVFGSQPPNQLCTLLICRACGFVFFEERFTSEEAGQLYGEYRSENYFRIRHKHEPWYTKEINSQAGESPETRKKLFDNFVREHAGRIRLDGAVLDYGGDKGQYISDIFRNSQKYVFELSDQEPAPNVTKIPSVVLLQQQRFDFIYFCNTLEHVSEPQVTLDDFRRLLAPNGLLYIEVPLERPKFMWFQSNRIYKRYLKFLMWCRPIFKMMDVVSLVFRLKLNWPLPPFCFAKLHEHINFFSVSSLTSLLSRTGYEAVAIAETQHRSTTGRSSLIQCLARANNDPGGGSTGSGTDCVS